MSAVHLPLLEHGYLHKIQPKLSRRRGPLGTLGTAFAVMAFTMIFWTYHMRLRPHDSHLDLLHLASSQPFAATTAAGTSPPLSDSHQPRPATSGSQQLQGATAGASSTPDTPDTRDTRDTRDSNEWHQTAVTILGKYAASTPATEQLQNNLPIAQMTSATGLANVNEQAQSAAGAASAALEKQIETLQAVVLQAVDVLNHAGVQLDILQKMQLDRLRMQVELYARGRLQQRRAALLAELARSKAVAMAVATPSTGSKTGTNPNEEVPTVIGASVTAEGQQQDSQGQHQQLFLQGTAESPTRGILIVAGTRHQLANALVTIMVLRQSLNSSLPVEIVYYGAAEYDDLMAQILHRYNDTAVGAGSIFLVDGLEKAKGLDLGYHYKVKIFAQQISCSDLPS